MLVAAGDTFRAGAIDQLRVWAERAGAEFVGGKPGADPAAVAFDAIDAAVARGADVVIVDTAGRLHTSDGLMDELKKVARVITKRLPDAPHETLLVLDGTIGQNAVAQAKMFAAAVPVTGLVVTKLDGTARGGIVVAVHEAIDVPVKFSASARQATTSSRSTRREFARELLGERVKRRPARRGSTRPSALDTPVTYLKGVGPGARRGARAARRRHRGRSALPRPASLRGREHRRADRVARARDGRHGHRTRRSRRACCRRAKGCGSSRRWCRTTAG